jgi:hypothetical protein
MSSSSSLSPGPTEFPDVIKGKYGYTAITELAKQGVLRGYDDGTFKPLNNVARAEFAKMLIAGLHPEDSKGEANCFPDVADEWFATFVCATKRLNWVSGYADGYFRPAQTMTKAEGIKIVVASLLALTPENETLTVEAGAKWYLPYVQWAVENKLLLEQTFDPNALATRADAAVWMYRASRYTGESSVHSDASEASQSSSIK